MKKIDIHTHIRKYDPNMTRYLRAMDKHDVQAILVHGVPGKGRENDDVLRVVKAHPDRFVGSAHVDLREPVEKCKEVALRYAGEGFKSIKLFPNLGFDPNDEHLEPFWQVVEDLRLLCFSHCGWLSDRGIWAKRRLQSSLATPFHFEVPARLFPRINFIFGHFGGSASYLETVTLISRLRNAYADTCPGWGKWIFENRMPGLCGVNMRKIMFGTDGCGSGYGAEETWWKRILQSMDRSEREIKRFFYDNAAKLLGVK